jgi:hypothetical protein
MPYMARERLLTVGQDVGPDIAVKDWEIQLKRTIQHQLRESRVKKRKTTNMMQDPEMMDVPDKTP